MASPIYNSKGSWAIAVPYDYLDAVTYKKLFYVCTDTNGSLGQIPLTSPAVWFQMPQITQEDDYYLRDRESLLQYEDARFQSLINAMTDFYPTRNDQSHWGAFLRAVAMELAKLDYMYSYDIVAKNPLYLTPPDIKREYADPLSLTGSFQQLTQFDSGDFGSSFGAWNPSTGVIARAVILDSNGNLQICSTSGTTGLLAPSWALTIGDNTLDGDTVWTNSGQPPTTMSYPVGYRDMVADLLKAFQEGATAKALQDVIYAYTGKTIEVEELYKQIVPGGYYDQSDRNTVAVTVSLGGNDPFTNIQSQSELQQVVYSLSSALNLAKPAHVGVDFTTIISANENVSSYISPRYLTQYQLNTLTKAQVLNYGLISYVLSTPITARWTSEILIPVYTVIKDTNGNIQLVTSTTGDGLSGATSPTWSPILLGTTTDGNLVWTNIGIPNPVDLTTDEAYQLEPQISIPAYETLPSASYSLNSVAGSSGSTAVYTGTITGGSGDALAGHPIEVVGFPSSVNNGTFLATASTSTTLTLSNSQAVAETNLISVTGYSISGDILTLNTETITVTLTTGQLLTLSGFPTSTFLNGQTITISSATLNTITGAFNSPNTLVTESGTITLLSISPTATDVTLTGNYQGYYQNLSGSGINDTLSIKFQIVEEPPFNPMLYQAPIFDVANPTTTLASFGQVMLSPLSPANWLTLTTAPVVWDSGTTYNKGVLVRGVAYPEAGSWITYRAKKKNTGVNPVGDTTKTWTPLPSPSVYQAYYPAKNGQYVTGISPWVSATAFYPGQFMLDNNGNLQIQTTGATGSPLVYPVSAPTTGMDRTQQHEVVVSDNVLTLKVLSTVGMGLQTSDTTNPSLLSLTGFALAPFLNGLTLPVTSFTPTTVTMPLTHADYDSLEYSESLAATIQTGFNATEEGLTYDGQLVWKNLGASYLTNPSKWIQVVDSTNNPSGEVSNWNISSPMGLLAPRLDNVWEISNEYFASYELE